MQLTYSDVAEILKMIDASSCEELDLEMGEFRLVVRKFSSHPLPEQSMQLVSSYDLGDGGNVITHDSEKSQSSVSSTADKAANPTDGSCCRSCPTRLVKPSTLEHWITMKSSI